ncbi:MAG: Asp-tRNA(Asn)/Glu-tRNA(Gln) amidotransferase subunit GatB [Candidatus Portnoybacteria bacterium CG10_big_fil_rev_8_21_14_0_10_44_7]|uniref:Aspartyl/glutamyl-tRNA(Asn/Gln) amidotransferase subunit B n=1 Tax=Candidatus Portnoybacteria bacterium CG10_big_fil_rev_8_21_14_0_10_44_7 TaxID=1974816 RepID=A0A2M8KIX9_9BACT|nr:MAG: Asp-tRNA(Asn)/Glu-tRNA(Gln) amidotransferase subunit GatB [Candidatus Portnoybacteria bacterium CG10_big_fil_rev_8_21_14_0_10_44_7]
MPDYQPTIGLEIHAELKTKSKMFCACPNGQGQEKEPNLNICPVCTGQPGALPVINQEAVKMVLLVGRALNCQINENTKFDRKNYFYPDLPKGYQISQYDQPLTQNGYLAIGGKKIGITRVHLEEDTGKSIHSAGADQSLVDLNRSGVPLLELVSEPDITSGQQAKDFCQELQRILRYLGVSDADMEKGQMRCEVNISISKDKTRGTKVEIKNLNSFRTVQKAIDFEIARQQEALEFGEKIIQETRGWNEAKQMTVPQRAKEQAHDYRYFPEPDLPPMRITTDKFSLAGNTVELPQSKKERFEKEYKLTSQQAQTLVNNKALADFFEAIISEAQSWAGDKYQAKDGQKLIWLAANYLLVELPKILRQRQETLAQIRFSAEDFAELMCLINSDDISSSAAQTVLAQMQAGGGDPSQIIAEKKLSQIGDRQKLAVLIAKIISANPKAVADYKRGQGNAVQFLLGQIMKETKGAADPLKALAIIKEQLN